MFFFLYGKVEGGTLDARNDLAAIALTWAITGAATARSPIEVAPTAVYTHARAASPCRPRWMGCHARRL